MFDKLVASRTTRFICGMLAIWAVAAILTDARDLFLFENAAMTGIAVAVMFAYWRVVVTAIQLPKNPRANLLALGIFFAWAGTAILRLISILIWGFELPFSQTDFSTFGLFLQIMAGIFHLAAPAVDPGGIWPMRERIKTAAWCGIGVFVMLVAFVVKGRWT